MIIFLGIISAIIVISYVIDLKNNRMNTKEMVMASLIAAISFILSLIHPVQFLLDYIFPTMALGLAGTFGSDTRIKRIFGPLMAVVLNVFSKFLSGVVFFGAFAPENMGAVLYSLVYNGSTAGVEGVLCVVILAIMPFDRLKKHV